MIESLPGKVRAFWPPQQWRDVTVIAAVSGGADSVAMLRVLAELLGAGRGQLIVAHFNHQLRGPESDRDEEFVGCLSRDHCLRFVSGRPEPSAPLEPSAEGIEEAAREQRYRFFEATARECGARFVATAHNADDQAETIMHRILRGTGLAGLAGIPRSRCLNEFVTIVRPMLSCNRAEILAYLSELSQPYREDPTNGDPQFTRNRIRHHLLPQLAEEYNPQVTSALLRLQAVATEAQRMLNDQASALAEACCERWDTGLVVLRRSPLRAAPEPVTRQLLMEIWTKNRWPMRAMSYDRWQEIVRSACSDASQFTLQLPGGVVARARDGQLILARE